MPIIESSLSVLLTWGIVGYLLGSIPSGVILARVMGLGNLRDIGSGNIGATNVLRTGNKTAAAATLLLDAAKGVVAVLLARAFASDDAVQLAALMAFLGHCFPVWLAFKGGKGVATFFGITLALSWPVGLASCVTWLVVAATFRFSSLAALMAAGLAPVWAVFLGSGTMALLCFILAILVYSRHLTNIRRLREGTEPKLREKS